MIGRYERGIFITTSTFSAGAQEEAEQPGATIILINGDDLETISKLEHSLKFSL